MQLPLNLPLSQMQSQWKGILDPILGNPLNSMLVLPNVKLNNGVTVINHLLGRKQQGFVQLDIDGAAIYYRSAPLNDTTLTLTSNASVNVTLGVY
jgi:hypothetical protein